MIKVGINGFGRIGRFVFRAAMKRNDIQIVGINDLCPVDYLAYMLKYDTMHGQFDGSIEADVENSKLIVNGQAIRITAERNPADLKWNEVGAEYVVESTGLFLSKDKAQAHIEAGAKYVVIHGAVAHPKIPIPDERYFERFNMLIDIGKREGVTVCQENVNRFKSESIEFCKKMRSALGDDFHMVFDIKQTVRAGQNTFEFLEEFKNEIVHMHISDHNSERDCLPP